MLREAVYLHRVGRRVEAEQGYAQLLALTPDNADALDFIATVRVELSKNDLALKALQRLRPRDPLAHFRFGHTLFTLDRRRSMPLRLLEPLLAIPGVSFYSLQKGAAAQQLVESQFAPRVIDYTASIEDFADTEALLDQLDLPITVDTSVVHLAGTLGKPVWMLNRFGSRWRWGPHREDAPWYPTLRIFRQEKFGDWGPVVDRVAQALRDQLPSIG